METKFLVAVCDDDKVNRKTIIDIVLNHFENIGIKAEIKEYTSGEDLLKNANEQISLLFLDIEMPGRSGIEIKDILTAKSTVSNIVYVTNHIGFMKEAFGKNVIGFMEKPIDENQIIHWVNIAYEAFKDIRYISIDKNAKIKEDSIKYIEAEGNYVRIMLVDCSGGILQRGTIASWEKQLDGFFVRCHKSFLVNMNYITSINYKEVELEGDFCVPLGRNYVNNTKNAHNEFMLEKIKRRVGW
ncbi:MAG: response regulator transcription factor [Pseudobutyrivibrio sp.]|uniref:LytR/AlgR family response regulator transcription factor n=1 Tax=Pseudobutyrivibrio sp. TaxID=2014367 RepID=UPI0025E1A46B|nr:LytTR family DNA-binding domain-containing protein [Pseudobutyrivibrio sp.]MBE5904841.1 response regulator transcription factor [Pseudobutyrivibrio sp.]